MKPLMLLLVTLLQGAACYKMFEDEIPNGAHVPHPCKPNYIWHGVGHQSVLGGGARNPFGRDFSEGEKKWTAELCRKDSDGDGKTNGMELGDPECKWTKGSTPSRSAGLSHPGVCEPTDSDDCLRKNPWPIDCSGGKDFACPGINDSDTLNITLKFKRTQVPARVTTYICQKFQIPSDRTYHLIATKPDIDNEYVMHHTLIYGCPAGVEGFENATECGMGSGNCILIGGWTVGSNGECHHSGSGFLIGKDHYNTILVQHHWNNPSAVTNYTDASGIILYLTPKLRGNSLGFLVTGQQYLEIPAGSNFHRANGVCKGSCTNRKLQESIYIVAARLHMHYLGISGRIEQWRDGVMLSCWFNETMYSYDMPVKNVFDPPIELKPGDEIRTICDYKSTSKSNTTYQGEATSDEMCYGFMHYYPSSARFKQCVAYKNYDTCDIDNKIWLSEERVPGGADRLKRTSAFTIMIALLSIIVSNNLATCCL